LGTELKTDFSEALDEAEDTMATAREILGYYQAGFIALIVFILLTIGGIILIQRKVRGSTRLLGVVFLIYGVLEYSGVAIARSAALSAIPDDAPASMEPWLTEFAADAGAPLEILAIVSAAIGVALVITSFVYRRRRNEA
jgi:hypothetical protein